MRTYNLFRRKVSPDLACAVPENHPVPSFINAGWEFVGRVGAMSRTACRFNHDAAEASVQFNGFYLFQLIKPCREHVIPSPISEQSELAQADPLRGDKAASSSARRWLLDPAPSPELIGA